MSDFAATWTLIRQRFDDAVRGLSHEQINWRMQPDTLTIAEMAIHVAGAEVSFCTQMLQREPNEEEARIAASARDGVINESPFPFSTEEMSPERVFACLDLARAICGPMITNPDPYRNVPVVSALGPTVDGSGAFARLAYHPGYHQGQVHMIRTAPGFPAN